MNHVYYNEYDKNAAAWLRQLIEMGCIANGEVDERSIIDVQASDLRGFSQHHFFAGIGGWSLALRMAGWPDEKPVCTASLPCQPFSVAGKQSGKSDERNLLPHFIDLVKQCNWPVIFGEQVPPAIKHGWLDDLCDEMERENYAVGSIVLTAAGGGAPHIRQRLYWVADSQSQRFYGGEDTSKSSRRYVFKASCNIDRMADSIDKGLERYVGNGYNIDKQRRYDEKQAGSVGESCDINRMVHPDESGSQSGWSVAEASRHGHPVKSASCINEWTDPDWILCKDNKYRPIKPTSIWMVNGISCRMVHCCNEDSSHIEIIEKEMTNAKKTYVITSEILSVLQYENGTETIPKCNRGHDCFHEAEILQSILHGESIRGGNENGNITEQSQAIEKRSKNELRGVWKNTHVACSSCGRESYEQLAIEFDDIMFKMPQGSTLTKFLGADGAEYMQTLRKTSDENRPLLDSQYSAKEIWKSLNDKEKDRLRVHFNSRSWIITESLKPLVNGVPRGMVHSSDANNSQMNRVMRLKGYGNAIVPQLAAQFIEAFMLCK